MSIPLPSPDTETSPARGDATITIKVFALAALSTVGVLHIAVLAAAFATSRPIAITYLAVMLLCGMVAVAWRAPDGGTETPTGTTDASGAHPILVEDDRWHGAPCAGCLSVAADRSEEARQDRSPEPERRAA